MAARFIPRCSQEEGYSIFREYFQGQGGLGTRRGEWKDEGDEDSNAYVEGDILGDRPSPREGTDMTEKGFSRITKHLGGRHKRRPCGARSARRGSRF